MPAAFSASPASSIFANRTDEAALAAAAAAAAAGPMGASFPTIGMSDTLTSPQNVSDQEAMGGQITNVKGPAPSHGSKRSRTFVVVSDLVLSSIFSNSVTVEVVLVSAV